MALPLRLALSEKTTGDAHDQLIAFPFEKMAPELRNAVYDEFFKSAVTDIYISRSRLGKNAFKKSESMPDPGMRPVKNRMRLRARKDRNHWQVDNRGGSADVSILMTSRTIYAETLPYAYGSKKFIFDNTAAMQDFVAAVGQGLRFITSVQTLNWGATLAKKVFPMLVNTAMLRSLTITLPSATGTLVVNAVAEALVPYLGLFPKNPSVNGVSVTERERRLTILKLEIPSKTAINFGPGIGIQNCFTPTTHEHFMVLLKEEIDKLIAAGTTRSSCTTEEFNLALQLSGYGSQVV